MRPDNNGEGTRQGRAAGERCATARQNSVHGWASKKGHFLEQLVQAGFLGGLVDVDLRFTFAFSFLLGRGIYSSYCCDVLKPSPKTKNDKKTKKQKTKTKNDKKTKEQNYVLPHLMAADRHQLDVLRAGPVELGHLRPFCAAEIKRVNRRRVATSVLHFWPGLLQHLAFLSSLLGKHFLRSSFWSFTLEVVILVVRLLSWTLNSARQESIGRA